MNMLHYHFINKVTQILPTTRRAQPFLKKKTKKKQSKIITRRTHRHNTNYTIQIFNNSLRKTQNIRNPFPKIDSKEIKTIMDARVRNHT